MNMRNFQRAIAALAFSLTVFVPAFFFNCKAAADRDQDITRGRAIIWQDPGDMSARNLYFAQGSGERAPKGKFKFIKEDHNGSNPKYEVADEHGLKWRVKIGNEAQCETVATHLLWAVGYFTDETYFLPMMKVDGLKEIKGTGGAIIVGALQNARLERDDPNEQVLEWQWSWFDNPFVGTKEFDGLRVMMALINNWDLKNSNNKISLDKASGQVRYAINDLGASFGRTGGISTRSRNDVKSYIYEKFVEKVDENKVDLVMNSRPSAITAIFAPTNYVKRSRMEKVTEDIPIEHARWIGGLLAQLSDDQLRDAFRAAHYKPEQIELYVQALRLRINELVKLS